MMMIMMESTWQCLPDSLKESATNVADAVTKEPNAGVTIITTTM